MSLIKDERMEPKAFAKYLLSQYGSKEETLKYLDFRMSFSLSAIIGHDDVAFFKEVKKEVEAQ